MMIALISIQLVICIVSGVTPAAEKGDSNVDVLTDLIRTPALPFARRDVNKGAAAGPLATSARKGTTKQHLKFGRPLLTSRLNELVTLAKDYWKMSWYKTRLVGVTER